MSVPTPESALPPGQARAAELHLRVRLGSGDAEPLSEAEQTEYARLQAEHGAFLAELDAAEAALARACADAAPAPGFRAKVLAALPAAPEPALPVAAPAAVETGGTRVFTASSAPARPRWLWPALATAALLAVALLGQPYLQGGGTSEGPGEIAIAPKPREISGVLVDADGKRVERVEAGKRYRVEDGEVAAVKLGENARVRLAERTEFELSREELEAGLRLYEGMLYAHEAGRDGKAALTVDCADFSAQGRGKFVAIQEAAPADPDFNPDGWGQGIVIVFQGSANIMAHAGAQLTLKPGEMYITDGEAQDVQVFLAGYAKQARELDVQAANPVDAAAQRALYQERVAGFRRNLKQLDESLATATSPEKASELKRRRALVAQYLDTHAKRLESFAGSDEDTPAVRAKQLRRAGEKVERVWEEDFPDPAEWF